MTLVMAYVILISAAVASVAVVGEMIMRSRAASGRWTWLGALVTVAVMTLGAMVLPVPVVEHGLGESGPPPVLAGAPVSAQPSGVTVQPVPALIARADRVMPIAWLCASLALLVAIMIGQRWLARERRRWRQASVNGRDVLVTDQLGPAVAGVRNPVVFVPQWVLALDHASQELLLAHEFEHVKRGDTRLLVAGAISAALMPWNPMVWWMVRRLRLSVEQDCDARVLATHPDVRRYADLLLTAASRHGLSARLLAAHFGEHRSDLERRIKAMADTRLEWRRMAVAAMVAAGLGVVSCETPRPEPVAPGFPAKETPDRVVGTGDVLEESQVEKPVTMKAGSLTPSYPAILREAGVEGEVLVSFVVNESGVPDSASLEVVRATHELFAVAVRKALPGMRFEPAQVGGKAVKQMVQQPFTFSLPGPTEATGGAQEVEVPVGEAKKLAFIVRRGDRSAGPPPNVVILGSNGKEVARYTADGRLDEIKPEDIRSIEVFKPTTCPASAEASCPLIRITLKPGKEAAYKR